MATKLPYKQIKRLVLKQLNREKKLAKEQTKKNKKVREKREAQRKRVIRGNSY